MSNTEIYEGVVIIVGLVAIVIAFFCPIILSIWTGDWFHMFLFLISWIPTFGVIAIMKFLLTLSE